MAGTPEYIAPEQARGLAPTPRTDLYCLGVMMFEMLTGTRAFDGEDATEVFARIIEREPDFTALPAGMAVRSHLMRVERSWPVPPGSSPSTRIVDAEAKFVVG